MKRALVLAGLLAVGGGAAYLLGRRVSVPMAPGGAGPEENTGPGSPS